MPVFIYTAQDEKGQAKNGSVEASQELEAIANLQRQGFLVLSIREDKAAADGSRGAKKGITLFGGGVSAADLIFLAEQLSLLLKGGVPLLQGLKLLGQNVSSPVLVKTIDRISQDVAAGTSFHVALGRYPKVFGPIWQAMVEAGEASGQLPKTLEEVSNYLNQRDTLMAKIMTAFLYPSILILTSIGVLIFFIVKVVPIFTNVFESFNLKLPTITAIVVAVSKTVQHNFLLIIGGLVGAVVGWKLYMKTVSGQWMKSRMLIKLPIFGNFVLNMMTERFLVNFALLLKSGVDVINSLAILERLFSGNRIFAYAISRASERIKGGGTIAQGFSETRAFPDLVNQMIRMGEESGKLPEIMETLANFYRRQIEQFIARLSSIIDPIMVLGVGALVTIIVLAVFMPIFQLAQIGGGGGG